MVRSFRHFSLGPEVNKSLYQSPVTSHQSLVTSPQQLDLNFSIALPYASVLQ